MYNCVPHSRLSVIFLQIFLLLINLRQVLEYKKIYKYIAKSFCLCLSLTYKTFRNASKIKIIYDITPELSLQVHKCLTSAKSGLAKILFGAKGAVKRLLGELNDRFSYLYVTYLNVFQDKKED